MEQKPTGSSPEVTLLSEHERQSNDRSIVCRHVDILISFLAMTVPMLFFSALLLGLIYRYQVVRTDFSNDSLHFDRGDDGSGAFLVDLSATTLTTIASWSSTVAPVLVGFALSLLRYPIARTLSNAATANRPAQLPTPYQTGLMIGMVAGGGPGSFWQWLKYAATGEGRRQRQPGVLKQMAFMLFLGILLR
jgi:hypothetical protein